MDLIFKYKLPNMSKILNFGGSLFLAAVGYFSPIKDIFHLMLGAILFDMVVGIIASKIIKKEKIIPEKIWMTVIKAFFATSLVGILYLFDTIMGFAGIMTHKAIAWLITIVELWAIAKHMGEITNHPIFNLIRNLSWKKIKDSTGIDLNKKNGL